MRTRAVAFLALGALVAGGCANPAGRLREAERENQRLSGEVAELTRAVQSVNAYTEELRAPGAAGRSFRMYYSPASLEQMASQLFPLRMAARNFHQQLQGEVILERLSDVRFGADNTFTCRATLRGENIRYTGSVPKMYQARVRQFQSGVASGVVADLVVELSMSPDNTLLARAHATRTKLRVNSDSSAEDMLRGQMNDRVLRTPFSFSLSIPGGNVVPRGMLLTANHLVITYAPE
ncbi:hypothetical protein [Melittangium boletus]|uniref:Lipoprotein n=1 Tax=Melittangium boletus DSM 14713 TaxID=1294270 RepID=A0A250I8K0_9BACT|nr:hypothetical protein [Melittangium boletus]ATB27533.1 hypothetical protein MEBOL_000976 [Melittangium boletus DSM 14713]